MIVLKAFIARENLAKYNAGDDFPRADVSPARIAELVKKGYLKAEESEAPAADKEPEAAEPQKEEPAKEEPKKPAKSRTPKTKTRAKKG